MKKMYRYALQEERNKKSEYIRFSVYIPKRLYLELYKLALERFGNIDEAVVRAIELWIDIVKGRARIVYRPDIFDEE